MEKRLFLAFFISFGILYLWSIMFGKPKDINQNQNNNILQQQNINQNQKSISDKQIDQVDKVPQENTASKNQDIKEKLTILENDNLKVTFSNIGGSVKDIYIKKHDKQLPVKHVLDISGLENLEFKLESLTENEVVYLLNKDDCEWTKIYRVSNEDYIIEAQVLKNGMSKDNSLSIKPFKLDMSNLNLDNNNNMMLSRDKGLFEYVISLKNKTIRKNKAYKFLPEKDNRESVSSSKNIINWLGFRDRYYCFLVKPMQDFSQYKTKVLSEKELQFSLVNNEGIINKADFFIYVGPEDVSHLKKYNLGLEKIQKYYRFVLFDGMSKILYNLLMLLHKIIPSWGICIILLSKIIYFSVYPLTMRSMSSMKKIQSVQLEMNKIKEKYKNDPQRQNQEIVELYRKNNINPLGGCLPVLLQMPIFVGLYQVLWRAVMFKNEHFLWIKDLSEPDRLFTFNASLPIIGNEINILPICMLVIMVFQQKLTSKNMVATDPAQVQQQKIMAIVFPLFLGFIFYKLSSGLNLYFTMFYVFSTITQWRINK